MGKRFAYLDNLRSFVIFLVVVMHSNVTYSGMGGWYYKEGHPESLDWFSRFFFGLYGSFTQAWFMGVLFFLAAYFAVPSLAKRGPSGFVKERLFRLGIPLLLYMFIVDPFIGYFLMNYGGAQGQSVAQAYLGYLGSFRWGGATGPLWFAEVLLVFSLLYVLWRLLNKRSDVSSTPPKKLTLVLVILATGLAAFSIRLFLPVGTSVANLQIGYFASYVALFLLGLHAGEKRWLDALPDAAGMRWFNVVLSVGLPLWGVLMVAGGALGGNIPIGGGLVWQSFAYAFWEAFVAVGFSLGAVVFFRKFLNRENAFTRLLAQNSFGVYMFHAPVLIAVSLLLRDWPAPLLVKHLVVAPLAYCATLAGSALILRRIPGLRAVLK